MPVRKFRDISEMPSRWDQNRNIEVPDRVRLDLESGRVDPRLLHILSRLAEAHLISIRTIKTGHPKSAIAPGGRINDHFYYRAADIDAVDNYPVKGYETADPIIAIGRALMNLPPEERARRVMGPREWLDALGEGDRTGFRDDEYALRVHADHIHIGVG